VRVERVTSAATLALRQRVLRPHETLEELARQDAGRPEAVSFAAVDAGEVIGTASVREEPPPWAPDAAPAWRLRGMATAEEQRNRGIGSAVLTAVLDHLAGHGGGLLWCNARVPAVPFYERAGFSRRGEAWVDPAIGPHIAMERQVDALSVELDG
jgi:GNAT superfamily N-acetyltransferase